MGTFCVHIHANVPIMYYSHGLKCATNFSSTFLWGYLLAKIIKETQKVLLKLPAPGSIRLELGNTGVDELYEVKLVRVNL